MLLSGVLLVLFLAGCWLYCLTDAALTPTVEYRGLSKGVWICIICATFVVGALAWLIARRSRRSKSWVTASAGYTWYSPWAMADAAVARHPAAHAKQPSRDRKYVSQGPDDDPEFLRQLDRRIRGTSDPGELRTVT